MRRASPLGLATLLCFLAPAWAEEAKPTASLPASAGAPAPAAAPVPSPSPTEGPSAGPAKPETSEPIALADLVKGDRILLLMKNGQQFEGQVAEATPTAIRLDFTFSRQKMTGVVNFPRPEAAGARKLPALTKEEEAAILEKRRQGLLEARAQWAEIVGPAAAAPGTPGGPTAEQKPAGEPTAEEQQMADYRALLTEFPPDQGWGPERLAQIRYRHFILGLPPTYQERRFWQIFDQWSEAKTKVELYDQSQKQARDMLVTLFPPEEGWNAAKKQQLEQKKQSGEQLARLEEQFLKDYDAWQKAVAAKQAEGPAGGQAPATGAPAASTPTPPAPAPSTPPASPPAPRPASPAPASPAPESPGGSQPATP